MITIALIIGFAFLLEACFGFGSGFMATPLLCLFMSPKDAVFLMLVFQCLKVVLLIPAWKHISWKSLNLLPVGMFFGIIVGTYILDVVSPDLFQFGLAVYLISFVISDYIDFKLFKREKLGGKAGSVAYGIAGGTISGMTGMGSPPYAIYLRTMGLDKLKFRASMILIVSIGNYFRFFIDAGEIIHNEVVRQNFIPCFVAFAIATVIGAHLPKFLSEKAFKHSINAMLLGSSLMLMYKAII